MTQICDSYSETNWSISYMFYQGSWLGVGQAFSGNGRKLESAEFYMMHSNAAAGTAYAKIYNIMWTYGSSAVPLYGSDPLAVSDGVDVSGIPDVKSLVSFNFSGANQITLGSTTKYCLTLEVDTESVHPDYLYLYADNTDPTHSGNLSSRSVGFPWGYTATSDLCFYVYTEDEVLQDIISNNSIIPSARL